MTPILIVAAIGFAWAVGFIAGSAYTAWARTRFIHSLMPATGEHTDFDEVDVPAPWDHDQRAGYQVLDTRRDHVRRGHVGAAAHSQSSTDPEARDHVR